MDRAQLEQLIRQVLAEKLGENPVKFFTPDYRMAESDRLDTGNPADRVFTHDLLSLEDSPRLGLGLMTMDRSDFAWTLHYDEIDYVLEGTLTIRTAQGEVTARAGEGVFIPRGTEIHFSAPEHARFLYVTYPADWQKQK